MRNDIIHGQPLNPQSTRALQNVYLQILSARQTNSVQFNCTGMKEFRNKVSFVIWANCSAILHLNIAIYCSQYLRNTMFLCCCFFCNTVNPNIIQPVVRPLNHCSHLQTVELFKQDSCFLGCGNSQPIRALQVGLKMEISPSQLQ